MSLAQQIAERFDPEYKTSKDEYLCRCPNSKAHSNGDKKKSFSIKDNPDKPFGVEFNCFVCTPGPLVQLIIDTGLIPKKGAPATNKERKAASAEDQARLQQEKARKKAETAKRKKAQEKAFKGEDEPKEQPGEEYLFDTYYYNDERDELFVRVQRFNRKNSNEKRFLPQRYIDGQWVDGLGEPPVLVPLLNIVEVRRTARSGGRIHVVEGEKLAKILTEMGKTATTNIGGAQRQWEHIWTLSLMGAEVVVVADNNEVGRKHAVDICKALFEAGGKAKLIVLDGLTNPKDDLEQWLDKYSFAAFDRLVNETDEFTVEALEPEEVFVEFDTFVNTDTANAERFCARFGRDLKWTEEKGWFGWDNRRFKANKQLPMLLAKKNAKLIYAEADRAHGKERTWLREWAKTSESLSKRKATLELVKSEPGIEATLSDFDRDPLIVNCQNGILSLADGKLIRHNRKYMCSRIIPVAYDPKATCPTFDRFLQDITDGDDEMIRFLWRCVGYSISGLTVEEVLFFMWGHGRNGKSKFIETIIKMMGEYGSALATESLMDTSGRETARHDLASLAGARIVSASETQEGQRLNESLVKRMTGGDQLRVRNLYHDFFDMNPVWKLWITGNYKPQIKGQDQGIWDRIILIPMQVYIPPEKRDPFLMQKFLLELPGILNKSVTGFQDYYHGESSGTESYKRITGLRRTKTIIEAVEGYKTDQDTIGPFLDDRCTFNTWDSVRGADLYAAYVRHCKARGTFPKSDKIFYDSIAARPGVSAERNRNGKFFTGIGLIVVSESEGEDAA